MNSSSLSLWMRYGGGEQSLRGGVFKDYEVGS